MGGVSYAGKREKGVSYAGKRDPLDVVEWCNGAGYIGYIFGINYFELSVRSQGKKGSPGISRFATHYFGPGFRWTSVSA